MNLEQAKDMLTLADHLCDIVTPESFDFSMVYEDDGCGATACAMGHAPNALPDKIQRGCLLHLFAIGNSEKLGYSEAATLLFGIGKKQANYLFTPDNDLPNNATKEQVAEHLREFVYERFPELEPKTETEIEKTKIEELEPA